MWSQVSGMLYWCEKVKSFQGKKLINAGGNRTNLQPPSIFGAVLALSDYLITSLSLPPAIFRAWSICKKDISLLIWPSTLADWDPPPSPTLSYPPRLPPPSMVWYPSPDWILHSPGSWSSHRSATPWDLYTFDWIRSFASSSWNHFCIGV